VLGLAACFTVWKDHRRRLAPKRLDHGRLAGWQGTSFQNALVIGKLPAGTTHRPVCWRVRRVLGSVVRETSNFRLLRGRLRGAWRVSCV